MKKSINRLTYDEDTGNVYYSNGKLIGEIYMEVDGYYVYVFPSSAGCWEAAVLREIADLLDYLNAPWDAEVRKYFSTES